MTNTLILKISLSDIKMKSNELGNKSDDSFDYNQSKNRANLHNSLLNEIPMNTSLITANQNRIEELPESNRMREHKTKSLNRVLDEICKNDNCISTKEKITTMSLDYNRMNKKQTESQNLLLGNISKGRNYNLIEENNKENAPLSDLASEKNMGTKSMLNTEKTFKVTLVPTSKDFSQIPKPSNFLPADNFSDSTKNEHAGSECSKCKDCEEHKRDIRNLNLIIDTLRFENNEILKNGATKVDSSTVLAPNSKALIFQLNDVQDLNHAVYSSEKLNRRDIETQAGLSLQVNEVTEETNFLSDETIVERDTILKCPVDLDESNDDSSGSLKQAFEPPSYDSQSFPLYTASTKESINRKNFADDIINEAGFEILNPLTTEEEADFQLQQPLLRQPENRKKFQFVKNIMSKIPNKIKEIKKNKVPVIIQRCRKCNVLIEKEMLPENLYCRGCSRRRTVDASEEELNFR